MRWWKLLGLAGVAGVAASGVLIARDERHRNAYSADEVRSRLHERASAADGGALADGGSGAGSEAGSDPVEVDPTST